MRYLKIILILIAVAFDASGFDTLYRVPSRAASRPNARDRAAIRKARSTFVSRIETGLPHESFEVWFRHQVWKGAHIKWEVNDCGEQTGTPDDRGRDFPMCVQASAESLDMFVGITLQVGTFKRGVLRGRPIVRGIVISREDEGSFEVGKLTGLADKWSEVESK